MSVSVLHSPSMHIVVILFVLLFISTEILMSAFSPYKPALRFSYVLITMHESYAEYTRAILEEVNATYMILRRFLLT